MLMAENKKDYEKWLFILQKSIGNAIGKQLSEPVRKKKQNFHFILFKKKKKNRNDYVLFCIHLKLIIIKEII